MSKRETPPNIARQAWELVKFWGRIPRAATLDEAAKQGCRTEISEAPTTVRQAAIPAFVRQYNEVKDDLNSTRSRAGNLLAATGVISGVVALAAAFTPLFQTRSWIALGGLLLTAVVVYCAVATTFLAIRAQQVEFWGQAELHPQELSGNDEYEVEYATALYITWRDNLERLRIPVGYLRDAQTYFRGLVVALGLLVLLTIAGTISSSTPARGITTPSHASPTPKAR